MSSDDDEIAPSPAPPPSASALRVESAAVGWSRSEVVRRWSWRAFLVSIVVAPVALGVAVPTDIDALGWISFLALCAGAGSAVTAGISGLAAGWRAPGLIEIQGTEIVVSTRSGATRAQIADVVDGWVEDPHGVRLRLKDGTLLSVEAPTAEAAEAILRAAGASVSQRVLGVPLTSSASRVPLGVPLALTATTAVGLAAMFFFATIVLGSIDLVRHAEGRAVGGLILLTMVMAVLSTMLAGLVSTLHRRRATIGVDGVSIKGLIGKTFIPYASVARVEADPRGVRLSTRQGDVLLPTWQRGEGPLSLDAGVTSEGGRKQRVILERIRRAAALHQPGGPELAILDRGGRQLEVWREEVRALVSTPGDYRRVHLDADDLGEIVADATAPAERRVAAVMALSADGRPETKDRIRIAIDTCADDELRAALEGAAEEELDAGALRRVVPGV